MSKPLYRISWSTQKVETATLLDEHNMNEGASVETWLCRDSNGREFTCSKFDWQLSEIEAWKEYEKELKENERGVLTELLVAQKNYKEAVSALLYAQQKVLSLTTKQ